jgi:pantetheine-phosphate adenylyltransferase
MHTIALYPGTFDPFTHGHVDILQRASCLFDKIILAIATGSHKKPMLSLEERLAIAGEIFGGMPRVEVMTFSGLLVDFMHLTKAHIVLRGIRSTADMEYEFQLAAANRSLKPDMETIFLKADPQFAHISASIVREIASMGGDLTAFVPPAVITALDTYKR